MLKVYNTLSQKKEIFKPRKARKVNLFVCGPTVYDFSHIGHARTYIVFDMIAKYLKQKGYRVYYLQNITDVDDKIINRAIEEKIFWKDLSRKFEKEYLKDMKALNITSVTKYARATDHIREIISQIERLLKKGYAYQIKDGIYYDISKFKDYGKLSKRTALMAEDAVSRIDEAKEKRNKGDFCLWKFVRPEWQKSGKKFLRIPSWPSPWGAGRPGWHIEDTAITEKYFGSQYDIHGGARDLIFPHHEAEICQMEAISGKKPMVKYWLHTGFLTVKGQKMAKSLGNFITIKDFLKKHSARHYTKQSYGVGARILRFFVLKTHYRSPIDYSEKEIGQVKSQLERIDEFLDKLQSRIGTNVTTNNTNRISEISAQIREYLRAFEKAMDDDFNTPRAMALVFHLISRGNYLFDKEKITPADAREILKFLRKIDKVFNFIFFGERVALKIPSFIKKMVKEREEARKKGDWKLADEIRRKIQWMGYKIEDTKEGPKIKKI
ncbi:MAG: cysteine--tRNA ligase [Patescibacteria group bacterium]|nr:cysteine--tRNA ligase [Patescibacteria group bacterium]